MQVYHYACTHLFIIKFRYSTDQMVTMLSTYTSTPKRQEKGSYTPSRKIIGKYVQSVNRKKQVSGLAISLHAQACAHIKFAAAQVKNMDSYGQRSDVSMCN